VTTVRDVLVDAERRLLQAGVPSPASDASLIVSFVLDVPRSALFMQSEIESHQRVRIERLITQRTTRVPLQHLLGEAPFRYLSVDVGPGVFIPRPETELLAEAAIHELRGLMSDQRIVVDLCAGSGAIGLALATEVDGTRAYAVELSHDALPWLHRNVSQFNAELDSHDSSVEVIHADAQFVADPGGALAKLAGTVAVVTCNPPYIPQDMIPREAEVRNYDPEVALFGGSDGLDVVRGIVRTAAILLKPSGLVLIEHADTQGIGAGDKGVPGVLAQMISDPDLSVIIDVPHSQSVWHDILDRTDLANRPRYTLARKWQGMT